MLHSLKINGNYPLNLLIGIFFQCFHLPADKMKDLKERVQISDVRYSRVNVCNCIVARSTAASCIPRALSQLFNAEA